MFSKKGSLSATGAVNLAVENEKAELQSTRREVRFLNELGLHARPAAEFVRTARICRSQISIIKSEERFSTKSIIEVLIADLNSGDTAIIEAVGAHSEIAVRALTKVVSEFSHKDPKYGWARCVCLEEDY